MTVRQRLSADERKKQIRETAKDIFLKKGFNNTTMEDVIREVGMSKGGVYRHYKSTSDMLYDLMDDGNHDRYSITKDYMDKNKDLSSEEIVIESTVMKLLDEAEYKSLYAILLVEAEKNEKLKELRDSIIATGREKTLEFTREMNLTKLECLMSEEWIAFTNSIILATETIGVREVFLKNKDLFRNIIRQYIQENGEKKQR